MNKIVPAREYYYFDTMQGSVIMILIFIILSYSAPSCSYNILQPVLLQL